MKRLLLSALLLPLIAHAAPVQKELINPDHLYQSQYYTQAIATKGGARTIHISGQWAYDAKGEVQGRGDLRAQAVLACRNLKAVLTAAGAKPEQVVKVNIYIRDYQQAHLADLEAGLAECFGAKREYASTLIGVQALALDGMLFEIEAIAVVD